MKKKHLTFILSFLVTTMLAQPYGEIKYNNGSTMGSGIRTQIHTPGFLMAGLISSSRVKFDKTDPGGLFTNPFGQHFQKDYYMAMSSVNSCVGYHDYVSTIVGVSAIETQGISRWYAFAAAYDEAVYVTLVDSSGAPDCIGVYPFNYPSTNISKPLIVQAQNKDFYVCGQFDTSMYVVKFDTTGTVKWSGYYSAGHTSIGGGGIFVPHDIIESPYNNDVVIVGELGGSPSYNRASDGFFLTLDATTGGVNLFKSIGDYVSSIASCNYFESIRPAYSNYGGSSGYVICGYSDPYGTTPQNTGTAWILKLDVSGNIIWDRLFTPASSDKCIAMGVVERVVPGASAEYYAVCETNITVIDGVLVLKLDDSGLPINVSQPYQMSEFYYPKSTPFLPVSIAYAPSGSANDDGLQLFANDGWSDHYFFETYFNGVNGCGENLTNIQAYENGPTDISPWINSYGHLHLCGEGAYDVGIDVFTPTQICSSNQIGGGSNAKMMVGLNPISNSHKNQIYPNPGNGNYVIKSEGSGNFIIYNTLGEIIQTSKLEIGENKFDLTKYENGLYFVKLISNFEEDIFQIVKN